MLQVQELEELQESMSYYKLTMCKLSTSSGHQLVQHNASNLACYISLQLLNVIIILINCSLVNGKSVTTSFILH